MFFPLYLPPISEVPESKERVCQGNILKGNGSEYSKLTKETIPEIQEAQEIPNRLSKSGIYNYTYHSKTTEGWSQTESLKSIQRVKKIF